MASLAGAPDKRDLAARARRMAQSLSVAADRGRLMKYAEELDHEADELERDLKSRKK
jgi:hypothetical protein